MSYPQTTHAKHAKQYLRQRIETSSPEELLIMLYEGAIRFLVTAKKALPENDIQTFHNNLIRTQNIITEFMSSLDMDLGGETAVNLFNLYEYLNYRLVQANIKKDAEMIDEVLDHLRKLKDTWQEAIRLSHREREALKKEIEGEPLDLEPIVDGQRSYSV
ncbi:MAG: flagellar export chaperone FliS [Vampirovibrionales bacterium]|nr:flagellar export chaperone FliS [Vampirovibrionales bacterium]